MIKKDFFILVMMFLLIVTLCTFLGSIIFYLLFDSGVDIDVAIKLSLASSIAVGTTLGKVMDLHEKIIVEKTSTK